jgi:hypothetical protein
MTDALRSGRSWDAVDAYLAAGAAVGDADQARPGAPAVGEAGTRGHQLEAFARCDAVMALTSKLSTSPDVAWAFDEARRLARSGARAGREGLRWYQRPTLAWSAAGAATIAALVLAVIAWSPPPVARPAADSGIAGARITFAPIIVGDDVLNRLANVAPVVMLGDQIRVA